MKRIGARNVKTAVSVFICLMLYQWIGQPYSIYACIAAVICTQNTMENSFLVSKGRVLGTIFGGFLAYIFAIFSWNNPAFITLGIIILIYFGNVINKKEAISMSCVVFLSILINLEDVKPLEYTIYRVIETMVGIVVSLVVNRYLMIEKLKYFAKNNQ